MFQATTYIYIFLIVLIHSILFVTYWYIVCYLQSLKEFKTQATTLASLQHPNLCKLIGYYAKEDSNERMLVYERLYHGSLDKLLFGRSDGRFMDWSKRLKVALGAARGLAFLHDEGPFQVSMLLDLWSYGIT